MSQGQFDFPPSGEGPYTPDHPRPKDPRGRKPKPQKPKDETKPEKDKTD